MWSVPLLALLLFTVVVRTTAQPSSTAPNRTLPYPHPSRPSRGANTQLMEELLGAPNGGKRYFKSWDGRYLSAFRRRSLDSTVKPSYPFMVAGPPGAREQWIIEQVNDFEVILIAHNGEFMRHWLHDWANLAPAAKEWEMLTPVKNDDGSWSFKSRWNKWLSAAEQVFPLFVPENKDTLDVDELMANGGKFMIKSYNGRYLTRYIPAGNSCSITALYTTNRTHIGWPEKWTFERINDNEFAIQASDCKRYIRYYRQDTLDLVREVNAWEMWTAVKNSDGTWSFTTRSYGKWMSAHIQNNNIARVVMQSENKRCERWTIEKWE